MTKKEKESRNEVDCKKIAALATKLSQFLSHRDQNDQYFVINLCTKTFARINLIYI